MSWRPVVFTVTRVRGQTPSCATWAVVSAELDDTHEVVTAKCNAWPVPADELADRRFRASSKIVTGKYGEEQLQLYGVVAVDDAPSQIPSPSPRREPHPASPVTLSSFRYDPDRGSAPKRPRPPPGRTRWSGRGGGRGRLDVLPDELLSAVLERLSDDRNIASLARVCVRLRRLARLALQRVLQLNDGQMTVFLRAMAGADLLLSGIPGSGKTHLLCRIASRLPGCVLTASTGVAASHLGGMTVFSALGLADGKADLPVLLRKHMSGKTAAATRIKGLRTLVVDEVSMISSALLTKLVALVDALKRGSKWQLILVGDCMQMSPVDAATNGQFYESEVVANGGRVQPVLLTEPMRQEGDRFLQILGRMRRGRCVAADLEYLRENSAPAPTDDMVRIYAVNAQADEFNASKLAELHGPVVEYAAVDEGDAQLLRSMLIPSRLSLRRGARVMLLRNDVKGRYHNGSGGRIESLDASRVTIKLDAGGVVCLVKSECKTDVMDKNEKVLASRMQLPLRLGWAVRARASLPPRPLPPSVPNRFFRVRAVDDAQKPRIIVRFVHGGSIARVCPEYGIRRAQPCALAFQVSHRRADVGAHQPRLGIGAEV